MYRVYERRLEIPIKISRSVDEQTHIKKLERWPREAGLSVVLDESGSNFNRLIQIYAMDYGLELGQKSWAVNTSGEILEARLEIPLLKDSQERGRAIMDVRIPKKPAGEEGNNYIYTADVVYAIELDEQTLAESTTAGMVEFSL